MMQPSSRSTGPHQNPTILLLLLLFLLEASLTNATSFRRVAETSGYNDSNGETKQEELAPAASSFLVGSNLGVVDPKHLSFAASSLTALKQASAAAALEILTKYGGFRGDEVILPSPTSTTNPNDLFSLDDPDTVHVRLEQFWMGLPIEGISMVLHFSAKTGNVFALSGQYHSSIFLVDDNGSGESESDLDCETAVEKALQRHPIKAAKAVASSRWESECMAAAVQGRDGRPYLAYKRLRGYRPDGGKPYQRDLVFASRSSGSLVAVHPTILGALSLETYDCHGDYFNECDNPTLVSSSTSKISTSDVVANDAHNYAIDTYNFYKNYFGRDSLDNNGLKLKSHVHYGSAYVNAFYSGNGEMFYGDGDEFSYTYFCKGFDVVVHEFSHGVTDYSSNLVYQDDSGALNEAFSDVMAATAERLVKGKDVSKVWLLGEDVVIFSLSGGDGFRDMANPTEFGDPDHYADRYTDTDDHGGVHTNSGIMNYAFVLMVQGGVHAKSGVSVAPLNANFDQSITAASKIFYDANTKCLTKSSNFVHARECTMMFANAQQQTTVAAAWNAVGVRALLPLTNGVKATGLSLPFDRDVQFFSLQETLPYGSTVTCTVIGVDGDADLKVDYFRMPIIATSYRYSACDSLTPSKTEQCTTDPAPADRIKVYVSVEAYVAVSSYSVQCTINGTATSPAQRPTPYPTQKKPTPYPTQRKPSPSPPFSNPTQKKPTPYPTQKKPTPYPTQKKPTPYPTQKKPTPYPTQKRPTPYPIFTCKNPNESCTSKSDCCDSLACDGPISSTRICKTCKNAQNTCSRTSECCVGLNCKKKSSNSNKKVCK